MYKNIAQWISNNKRWFRKRFRILLWTLVGIWITWAIISDIFPKERAKISPFLETYRYIFTFGIIWAMGWIIYKQKKQH